MLTCSKHHDFNTRLVEVPTIKVKHNTMEPVLFEFESIRYAYLYKKKALKLSKKPK